MVKQNIQWYVDDPQRLLLRKPFVRGGKGDNYIVNTSEITPNTLSSVNALSDNDFSLYEISQRVYQLEYDPYGHAVNEMVNMPLITVTLQNGRSMELGRIVTSSAYQKTLHATQVQNLTHAGTGFALLNDETEITEQLEKDFRNFQKIWELECEESTKADIYSAAKSLGDVAVLFEGSEFEYNRRVLKFSKGYNQITNYDEFGREIAATEYYTIDNGKTERIDTYTNDLVYRFFKTEEKDKTEENRGWQLLEGYPKAHGYPCNPLLQKRDVVAWEYVQSYITILEILENTLALCQKNYSTIMLAIYGDAEPEAFGTGQSGIAAIKIENPQDNNKIDVLEFSENLGAYKYIDHLKQQIETFSFTTLGASTATQTNGSDSRGGAMTMKYKSDLALAQMTINDWAKFWQKYVKLLCYAWDMKYNDGEEVFRKLDIKMINKAWTPISDSLYIDNIILCVEQGITSKKTASELIKHNKRDEYKQIELERKEGAETPTIEKIEVEEEVEQSTETIDNNDTDVK